MGPPLRIFERVAAPKSPGVGINLHPNAVRAMFNLGLEATLDSIGVRTRQYGFYTKTGLPIWVERRGLAAGYNWLQMSVHRGHLPMMLSRTLRDRAGDVVEFGAAAAGFDTTDQGATLILTDGRRVDGTANLRRSLRQRCHDFQGGQIRHGNCGPCSPPMVGPLPPTAGASKTSWVQYDQVFRPA